MLSFSCRGGWNDARLEREEAMSLTPDLAKGERVYQGCAVCHMPEGWGTPNGAYPQIAGQHHFVTIKQLADIRAKNRDTPSMYPFAIPEEIGGSQAIADVASYIEQLKMTTATGKGGGDDLEHGKNLYKERCGACHGDNGEGDPLKVYPLIQGQHFHYVVRQLLWFQNGKRRNANHDMWVRIKDLDRRDLEAVADYISRMLPSEHKRSPYTWKNRR
jgi:cytochrome c553